jgi:long-chain acyl-CoA synthetase
MTPDGSHEVAAPAAFAAPLGVREALAGKHLFLTGTTGFLGKVYLVMLLDRVPDIGRVTLLVRGGPGESARARFERLVDTSPAFRPLRAKHGVGLGSFLGRKLEILDGDCGRPGLGFDEATLARLAASLDLCVHVAGVTDFDGDPLPTVAANVDGAMRVADLAARTRSRRMLHVSTCYVCGIGSREVPETITPDVGPDGRPFDARAALETLSAAVRRAEDGSERRDARALLRVRKDAGMECARAHGFPNTYTFTKSIAERLLVTRGDVELTIVRPAIVECARSYPMPGWNEGLNTSAPLAWLLSGPFFEFPANPDVLFDVVPVDEVAKGMLQLTAASLRGEAPRVVHLGTSGSNPLTMGRATDLQGLATRRHHARADATKLERFVYRYLDGVPVSADADRLLSPGRLEKVARGVRSWLEGVRFDRFLPEGWREAGAEQAQKLQLRVHMMASRAEKTLRAIDRMLALYRPFVHDNVWVFRTDAIEALDARLRPEEREHFGWDVRSIDWRSYWLDVQWPGLRDWCLPLVDGGRAPTDPPSSPPFRLVEPLPAAAVEAARTLEGPPVQPRLAVDAGGAS